jgi:hypothetical protein
MSESALLKTLHILYVSPAKIILMYMKRYVVPLNALFQLVGTCCLPGYLLEAAYQPVHLYYHSLTFFFWLGYRKICFHQKLTFV